MILGSLVLITLLSLNALRLRHKPQDLGLYPDGIKEGEQPEDGELEVMDFTWSETDWTLKSAFRKGRFWYLMFFSFLVAIVIYVILVHHVRFLSIKGLTKQWQP